MGGGDTWHRSAAPHLPRGEGPVSRRSGRGSRPLRNGSRQPPEGGGRAPPRRLPRGWQTKHSRRLPLLCLLPFPAAGSCAPRPGSGPLPSAGAGGLPTRSVAPQLERLARASAWLRGGKDGKLLGVSGVQGFYPWNGVCLGFPLRCFGLDSASCFSWNFASTFVVSDTIQ